MNENYFEFVISREYRDDLISDLEKELCNRLTNYTRGVKLIIKSVQEI